MSCEERTCEAVEDDDCTMHSICRYGRWNRSSEMMTGELRFCSCECGESASSYKCACLTNRNDIVIKQDIAQTIGVFEKVAA